MAWHALLGSQQGGLFFSFLPAPILPTLPTLPKLPTLPTPPTLPTLSILPTLLPTFHRSPYRDNLFSNSVYSGLKNQYYAEY